MLNKEFIKKEILELNETQGKKTLILVNFKRLPEYIQYIREIIETESIPNLRIYTQERIIFNNDSILRITSTPETIIGCTFTTVFIDSNFTEDIIKPTLQKIVCTSGKIISDDKYIKQFTHKGIVHAF